MLQTEKINLVPEKSFPSSATSMDVTVKDLLLVRNKEGTKYWIRVFHRLTGDLINEIPSMCNHSFVCLNKHPRHPDSLLESCENCEEIRAYNINTEENVTVHRGSKIARMCSGPAGSLLVIFRDGKVGELNWDNDESLAVQMICRKVNLPKDKGTLRFCYVECHDILLRTIKDTKQDQGYEIIAVKLGSETIIWRLSGPVEGRVIKPEYMTCDSDGNAYVNDKGTNRILKIDSLTGNVLSILLVEEEEKQIVSMRWSDSEPNLTLCRVNQISTYFIPNQSSLNAMKSSRNVHSSQ